KFFLQGYYIGNGKMSPLLHLLGATNGTAVDTVITELHRSTDPWDVLYAYTGVVQSNGNLVATFPSTATGSYYIVVKHRNSIATWSASPQTITSNGLYDFT